MVLFSTLRVDYRAVFIYKFKTIPLDTLFDDRDTMTVRTKCRPFVISHELVKRNRGFRHCIRHKYDFCAFVSMKIAVYGIFNNG
jgi:hypothetical protein